MQIKKPQLMRQQAIMKVLGFYDKKIEGIWGPESIAAKRVWERDPSFIPGLPNNGLPFGEREPLPKQMEYDRDARNLTIAGRSKEVDELVEEAVRQQQDKPAPKPEHPTPEPEQPAPEPEEETEQPAPEQEGPVETSPQQAKTPEQQMARFKKQKGRR